MRRAGNRPILKTAAERAEYREARVAIGLAELDRWLCDQVLLKAWPPASGWRTATGTTSAPGWSTRKPPARPNVSCNLGITGAVMQDPVSDRVVWREYLETVVRERDDWSDFYRACRDVAG